MIGPAPLESRILAALRLGPMSAYELGLALGVSHFAVRGVLSSLREIGSVTTADAFPGRTGIRTWARRGKPVMRFELTAAGGKAAA